VPEVLYRKYRPQTFGEVAGQEPVTRTLRNSIASGRLAHAYLLCGPRGTGKTSLGRLIAKAANCASPVEGEPCNQCQSCTAFVEGRAIDFVEQDAASHNSVDDIRQLRENVVLNPMAGGRKVYLLDEVHMLSTSAHNALLKTLEEPPPHAIFVLATTEPHKVPATVMSRCQRFDLRRIPMAAVVSVLSRICEAEGYSLEALALEEIARSATGSLRDAINSLEQVVTFYGRSPGVEQVQEALGLNVDARSGLLARSILAHDLPGSLRLIAAAKDDGVDMKQFTRQVVGYLRGLMLAQAGATEALDLPSEMVAEVKQAAAGFDGPEVVRALRTFGRVDFRDDPSASGGSLPLELAAIEFISTAGEAQTAPVVPKAEPTATRPRPEPVPAPQREPVVAAPQREPEQATAAPVGAVREPLAQEGTGEESTASPARGLIEQVRQACKEKETDKQLGALLNGSCEVKSLEGDVLTLGFYHTFHLERIESGQYGQRLTELFSAVAGSPVRVELVHAPRAPSATRAPGGHLVKAAQELGAKPIGKGEQGGEPRDEP